MFGFGPPQLLLCFTLLTLCLPALGRLAVMSIDLGGEYMKTAIVKPGVPMEIVLDKESSRKTRTIVAFRDGERHFANDAYNTAVRFPAKAFWFLTHIIGRSYDDPIVEQFRQRFPYYSDSMVKDEERGTISFKERDGIVYTIEELLGMILEKAREYAQDFAEQTIKDAVITVPPYYNQAERRAIITAAELVGINVLQLMNHNTAVALNYGVFRRKNFNTTAQYYMFYDMGATSTVATVVSYQEVKTKEGTRTDSNPQLTIKGVGYDRTLGGLEMTLRLRDHLAKVFHTQKKRSENVHENPRAMAKLLKEAERVKKVLSANAEHTAQVEGLLEGEDFAAKVTRDEYLEMISDLLDRVTRTIEEALKTSDITMGEISEIILMGGGSRIPRVQELLLQFSGKTELGKSVNTDEAAALGAVYQAAYLGKGFKVKTFHVRDANLFPINVEFEKQKTGEEEVTLSRTVKRNLFSRMNPYPQRKVMTFNRHFKDFSFDVRYGDLDFLPEAERKAFDTGLLSNISLAGVEEAYGKHSDGAEYKGVKAHFRMDESGVLHLEKVEAVFEKQEMPEATETKEDESTWSKIGNAFGGLFGGKEPGQEGEGKSDGKTDSKEETPGDESTDKKDKKSTKEDLKDEEEERTAKDQQKEEDKEEGKNRKKEEEKGGKDQKKKEEQDREKEQEGKKDEKEEEKKEPKKLRTVVLKENIKASVEVKDMADLSGERFKKAKKRLEDLQKKDHEKMAREKAKNELEGFIFDSQDKLSQELYESCSTQEERTVILEKLSEASDWLYEQPDEAKKEVFVGKLAEVKAAMRNVSHRVYEKEERPKALEALRHHLNATSHFLATVHNMTDPEDPIFTLVELTTLEMLINETTAWRDEAVKEQAKLASHENPTLLVEAIGSRIYALEREMKYLINKAKNFRPKPKTSEKADNTASKGNKTDSDGKKDSEAKKEDGEEEKSKAKEDEDEATVEDEDGEDSTPTPESQESDSEPPEVSKKDSAHTEL